MKKINVIVLVLTVICSMFNGLTMKINAEDVASDKTQSGILKNFVVNGGFEEGLRGWTVEGTEGAFYKQNKGDYGTLTNSGIACGNFYSGNEYNVTVKKTISNLENGNYSFSIYSYGQEQSEAYVKLSRYGEDEEKQIVNLMPGEN